MVNNITIKKENKQSDPCFFKIDMTDDNYNVSYEITNKCNLECQHCFNKSSKDASIGLNKDELSLLIKELKQINVKNVYITGGEPTCYPYFEYALETFYKNNIEIILATNGYNTLQYLDVIKKYCSPRAGVHISIDGMKDVHNELRGKKDAYEHAIKTIETLLENGIKVKPVNSNSDEDEDVEYDLTYGQVEKLARLAYNGSQGDLTSWPRIESVTNHWFYNDITFEYQSGTGTEPFSPVPEKSGRRGERRSIEPYFQSIPPSEYGVYWKKIF